MNYHRWALADLFSAQGASLQYTSKKSRGTRVSGKTAMDAGAASSLRVPAAAPCLANSGTAPGKTRSPCKFEYSSSRQQHGLGPRAQPPKRIRKGSRACCAVSVRLMVSASMASSGTRKTWMTFQRRCTRRRVKPQCRAAIRALLGHCRMVCPCAH